MSKEENKEKKEDYRKVIRARAEQSKGLREQIFEMVIEKKEEDKKKSLRQKVQLKEEKK